MTLDPMYSLTKAAFDIAVEPLKGFLSKILGPASDELAMLLADRVRLWRSKQALTIVGKAQALLSQRGIGPVKVSLKTLVPILEFGSLEEDESMQDKWAALLANAADPTHETPVPPAFPDILRQLSPEDAIVLDRIYDIELPQIPSDHISWMGGGVSTSGLEPTLGLSHSKIVLALDNLHRLGLCAPPTETEGARTYSGSDFRLEHYQVYLTAFGATFVNACRSRTL